MRRDNEDKADDGQYGKNFALSFRKASHIVGNARMLELTQANVQKRRVIGCYAAI